MHCKFINTYTLFKPGSVQICPLYPIEHSQVSLATQAPLTHEGLQITIMCIEIIAIQYNN